MIDHVHAGLRLERAKVEVHLCPEPEIAAVREEVQARIDHRLGFIDAPSNLRHDLVHDPKQMPFVLEGCAGQLQLSRPLDDFARITADPETRRLIRTGRTMGCFYIESPGMRALLERLECDTKTVDNALQRVKRKVGAHLESREVPT